VFNASYSRRPGSGARLGASVCRYALAAGLLVLTAPSALWAQPAGAVGDGFTFRRPVVSLTVRGGYDRPFGNGEIFDFSRKNLTLSTGDFAAAGYQIDIGFRISDRTEIMITGGDASRTSASEFRDFIDNNDQPIEQTTRLRRMPLAIGVKYALSAPGERIGKFAWIPSRFTPWVGTGLGAMQYTFAQNGDFVDFQTLNVFNSKLSSTGWAPMAYGHFGLDVRLTTRMSLTGDLRYTAARATLSRDGSFDGFGKIDLSGTAATMGFTFRL
jgi:hypothetical protein